MSRRSSLLAKSSRTAHHKRFTRRAFFEQLERREMLTAIPVALNDPLYATPLNTTLTISTAATGVVNNDFDPEAASLSASVVANPANGTLTSFSSNGTFTYVPNSGYTGIDTFTYKVNDGTYDSNVATVTIAVGGNFGPRTNLDERISGNMLHTGDLAVTQPLTMGLNLVYRSESHAARPVVVVETSLVAGSTVPNTIDAVLTFGTVNGSTVSYNTTGLSAGDPLRFVLQVDASSLSTGMYDWSVQLTANFTGSSASRTYSGKQALVNRGSSEFGPGWWLDGLDQLVTSSAGALLVRGNGDTQWFASDGGTGYLKAEGDLSYATLVKNGDNTYTLTDKWGNKQNFGTDGKLTSNVDKNATTTSFSYTSGKLSSITDHFSRSHSLSYTSGLLSSLTDLASRSVSFSYTSGKLTSVTQPDPDGASALYAPVWAYAYDGTTGLLNSRTEPDPDDGGAASGAATSFAYNSTSRRLSTITHPDSSTWQLVPSQTQGLKTGTGNSIYRPADVDAKYTDENTKVWKFKTDRLGNVTQLITPIDSNTTGTTAWEYDQNGNLYRLTEADPDGAGSQTSPITKFGYNASGDLLKVINPDATTLTWTYDSTLHVPLTEVDELSRTTTYTYNSYGNLLTRQDNGGNTWTYTVNARGQVASEQTPDPDGAGSLTAATTSYAYDTTASRLITITYPGSVTRTFTYTAADQVATITDELSHVTTLAYDNLDRLTSKTLADPDGGGSLTSPVWTYKYDAIGRLTEELDPLSNDTDYAYNNRNRVTSITRPDPDGGGSLGRPVTTFIYDYVGNRTTLGLPAFTGEGDITYTYNDAGWLISIDGPQANKSEDFLYDRMGRVTKHTTPLGRDMQYEYDSRSRVTKMIDEDPDGAGSATSPETVYAYNNAGQISSVTDPLGRVTSYTYTAAGWLNSVTLPDPDGSGPNYSPIYTYGYDALGRNTSVTDPLNRITVTAYDSRNRQTSVTGADPDGAGGQSAPVTTWAYDNASRVTSVTDPLSRVTAYGYDNLDRVLTVTLPDPDGGGSLSSPVHTYAYNKLNNVTTYTDPASKTTTIAYDNLQRQTSVTEPDPDGGGSLSSPVWTYAYGANTLLATVTDPLSHVTTLGYDDYGRKTTSTTDLGYVTTFAYDLEDKLTSVTTPDPDGAGSITASVTAYEYDIYDNLKKITDPLSGYTQFTYDKAQQLLTLDDPEGNTTTWAYDNLGRATMETNELNDTRSFYYDAIGNLTRKKDRNERVTQYVYDDLDRMTAEKWMTSGDPVPTIAMATTTQGGALSEVQRVGYTVTGMGASGGTFTLTFSGQTTSAIAYNASAATVQSALEALSNIGVGDVTVTKLQSTVNAQEWQVNFGGALASADQSQITINTTNVTAFGTKTNIQATDQNGQPSTTDEVQTVTLSNATGGTFRLAFMGQTTAAIAYNASAATVESALESLQSVDQVTVTGSAGGPWTVTFAGTHADTNVQQIQGDAAAAESGTVARTLSFTYDAANQLTAASDPAASYSYTLDNLGRVTSETQDLANFTPNVVLAATYDSNNNRLTLAATLGSNADFKNEYTYDYLNRMTRVTQQSNSGNTVATKRVDFAYNALGQFTTIDRYQNTGGTNIVAQTTFAYDDDSRLTDLDHKQSTTTLAGHDYSYDNMGRITSIVSSVEGTSTFTYDKTSQLTGADHASPRTDETYTYDDNGNRTMTGYTVTGNNLTTADGTYTYEYDDEGNRTKRTDSSGNYEVYEWDHRNRLISVTSYDSMDAETKSVDQTYDIFNRWIRRNTDPDGPGGSSAVDTFFAYDGIEAILQFDGSADTDLTNRYLWNEAVDQIMASEDVSSLGSAGNVVWPLNDHLGTPRDIADQNEGTYTTTVTNHRTYETFGKLTAETNGAVDLVVGYTGELLDSDTGLQNNWFRWYDVTPGQWTSEDPYGFAAGDSNLQRFVSNRAGLETDPTGLFVPGLGLVGAYTGALQGATIGLGITIGMSLITGQMPTQGQLVGAMVGGAVTGAMLGAMATGDVAGTTLVIGVVVATGMGAGIGSIAQQAWDNEGAQVDYNQVMSQTAYGALTGAVSVGMVRYFAISNGMIESGSRGPGGGQSGGGSGGGGGTVRPGATVYRIFDRVAADEWGHSWTTTDPRGVSQVQAGFGLFRNHARYVRIGRLNNTTGVYSRSSLPGPSTPEGALTASEIIVPEPALQITPITEFTLGTGP